MAVGISVEALNLAQREIISTRSIPSTSQDRNIYLNSQVTHTYKKLTRLEFERIVFKAPKDSLLSLILLKRKQIHIVSVTKRLFIAELYSYENLVIYPSEKFW